ncbi:MAG TPA: carboxypeptidase-like regulatory domain-containing protein [Candidatus Acidoferrales bacterium]|nr:carboxypeptidase-like regulatory domain-containing protein [Candidatus Acidoferrales bacterium]
MKRLLLTLVPLAALALGVALTAHARVAVGDIEGIVLTASGKPAGGATVIMQTSDGARPYATRSGEDGRFRFERYETGEYDLRASNKGRYSEWLKRVRIRAGKLTTITLRLTLTH